jgi:hypothetical protein
MSGEIDYNVLRETLSWHASHLIDSEVDKQHLFDDMADNILDCEVKWPGPEDYNPIPNVP